MTEESKKNDKPEGSGKKPNDGGKDKPGDQPGAAAAKPAESKPGDVGGAPPKPSPAAAAAKEPEKKTGPSVPASGAGARPGPSAPPPSAGAKPGPSTSPPGAGAKADEGKRPPAAPPKKAKKSGCLSAVLWLVVVLAVIAVGGYYTWPYWSHYVEAYLPKAPAPAEDPRVTELESRMAEVERKLSQPRPEIEAIRALQADRQKINERLANAQSEVESLQKAIASLGKMTEPMKGADSGEAKKIVAGLTERIDKLNQDLTRSVEQSAQSTTEIEKRSDEIEKRIDELEAKSRAADDGTSEAAAVALAVGQLAEALKGSGPFSAELNAVKAFAKDDAKIAAAIAALEPRAAGGVPTVAELRGRFPAVARAVVRADTKLEEKSWVERAVNRLSSLVTIRRTGERAIAAGGTDGALAGAEQALAANDLPAAIQAMETLEPPAADAAAGWLGDARARMTAERLLATLQTRAISLLAAKG
jgi:hypothetical protein